ncbi:MAG: HupE/UreJ family protein [Verrucomicrobiales bacterium]|nr:HupE/UreJ family protein [Verrucomicrobiales bacterium]MCP5559694.1 HupE/UreJ family protein [Verrucomicrobiaceae bacterium]
MSRKLLLLIPAASLGTVVPQYLGLGFSHILPHGLDHVLFILGLFFLARDAFTLLVQVTLFTLAHSLTLGLAMAGVISVPTVWVEVVIALSIAFVGIENLFQDKLSRWRPWMVFGFGLIHGLGFAHTFQEIPVDDASLLPALFSFNVGIELGQLAIIGIALVTAAVWWKRDWYVQRIARPASATIALVALYWAVERSL